MISESSLSLLKRASLAAQRIRPDRPRRSENLPLYVTVRGRRTWDGHAEIEAVPESHQADFNGRFD